MKTLSCFVSIAGSGALEKRRLMPFLFFGGEREPFFLIPRFLNHMVALDGRATIVVPASPSAPFWALTFTDEGLSPVSDFFEIPMDTDVLVLGDY